MSDDDYRIAATPHRETVAQGARVRYRCVRVKRGLDDPDVRPPIIRWYCFNAPGLNQPGGDNQVIMGPNASSAVWDVELKSIGKYMITCTVSPQHGDLKIYEYPQWVEAVESILSREMTEARKKHPPTLRETIISTRRWLEILRSIEQKYPLSQISNREKRRAYEKRVEHDETLLNKLVEMERESAGFDEIIPVTVLHHADGTQETTRLSVSLLIKHVQAHEGDLVLENVTLGRLLDWTNPTDRKRTLKVDLASEPYLIGADPFGDEAREKMIRRLLTEWERRNRYHPGTLKYEIPSPWGRPYIAPVTGSFRTDGASSWDNVSQWLDWIATGAAAVAGVVLLVTPVPGSQLLSGLLWGSMFFSTGAAIINIGQRQSEGFGNWKDDAFDALTIVANCFAVAGAWAKGATLASRIQSGVLVGQVAVDSVQGVMIMQEGIGEFDEIIGDLELTPDERANKLLFLFGRLAAHNAMFYVNYKATAKDLENLNRAAAHLPNRKTPAERLEELKDQNKVVRLDETPEVEGHSKDGQQKTVVQEGQLRVHPPRPKPPPREFPPALPPQERGMRPVDDFFFGEKAKEKGVYILVRKSNPDAVQWIGKEDAKAIYNAKPEALKAKTLQIGDWKGLAAANPEDNRMIDMLAAKKPPTTAEALKANAAEKQRRYDAFKKELEAAGFHTEGAEKDYIVYQKDPSGKKIYFHGDYDLHGVYSKEGNLLNSEQIRSELNADFGKELILHGAHDEWPKRNSPDAGTNRGPQPPVTAYLPDGTKVHLETIQDLKDFYLLHGLKWDLAYPDI